MQYGLSCDIYTYLLRIKYSALSTVHSVHQASTMNGGKSYKAAVALRVKSRFQARARRERSDVTKAEGERYGFLKRRESGEAGADVKWGNK